MKKSTFMRCFIIWLWMAFVGLSGLTLESLAADSPKDGVVIDQKNFALIGIPESPGSSHSKMVLIKLNAKVTLVSQEKGFLRAAINLEGEKSFKGVLAKEIGQGARNQALELKVDKPQQKILRVIVWIDKESLTAAPKPLASDNIAFNAAVFSNLNDR